MWIILVLLFTVVVAYGSYTLGFLISGSRYRLLANAQASVIQELDTKIAELEAELVHKGLIVAALEDMTVDNVHIAMERYFDAPTKEK